MKMPEGWASVYPKLAASSSGEVRELAELLALVFDDPVVLKSLRKTVMDESAAADRRRTALEALVQKRTPDLVQDLYRLLDDDRLCQAALRGLASYSDADTPAQILKRYAKLPAEQREDAIGTLVSRPPWALALLNAVADGAVMRSDISVFKARQIVNLGDEQVARRLKDVWGEIRQTSQIKQELIAKYKKLLTADFVAQADLGNGRLIFGKTCMKCHRLFGEGGQVGPDLTGSNRANLDYVLENVLDPSAAIGKDYQLTNITTIDGRLVGGIVVERTGQSITVQTENERVILSTDDIDEMDVASVSMMPEGQLDKMNNEEIRDLVAYLAAPAQVPLPAGASATATTSR
jgi:putative heme-binding domain-containing protein